MSRRVVIHWSISSFFGWGVYGLNLALQWARDPEIESLCALPLDPNVITIDPLQRLALRPFFQRSRELQRELLGHAGRSVQIDAPVLTALGNSFDHGRGAGNVYLGGTPTVAVVFFELPQLTPAIAARARSYELTVTGSTWNAQVLGEYGVAPVRTVLQGVDPALFHPAPATRILGNRFLVFSGGKLERRKGQDIALAAFRQFAARHPEALLVAAWHSPWPALARSLDQSGLVAPVAFTEDARIDVSAWAAAAGIPGEQVMDLGAIPNRFMPAILREWTWRFSRTGPKAAPTWSPWSAWPRECRPSCPPIPATSISLPTTRAIR